MKLLHDIVSLVDRNNDPSTLHKKALDAGEFASCLLVCLQVSRHHMWPAIADVADHLLQLCVAALWTSRHVLLMGRMPQQHRRTPTSSCQCPYQLESDRVDLWKVHQR